MSRTKTGYSVKCRGTVIPNEHQADITLTNDETLDLIRHLAASLKCGVGSRIQAHWGRRLGEERKHLITVGTP